MIKFPCSEGAVGRINSVFCVSGPAARLGLAAVLCLGAQRIAAAERPLTEFVPNSVGLCLEFDGLATRGERLLASDVYAWLQEFLPLSAWRAADVRHLRGMVRIFAPRMQLEEQQLWEALYGRDVVFGVWPSEEGRRHDVKSVLVTHPKDPAVWRRFLATICDPEKSHSLSHVEGRLHAGIDYMVRVAKRRNREFTVYFATHDDIGVMTSSESVMHSVLELLAEPEAASASLSQDADYRHTVSRVAGGAMMRMFVRPQQWAQQIEESLIDGDGPDDLEVFRGLLIEFWRAADGWATTVDLGERLTMESYLALDRRRLSQSVSELTTSLAGPSTYLDRVPEDAAFALAGHVDLKQLGAALLESTDEAHRGELESVRQAARGVLFGLDLFDEFLVGLGPNVGAHFRPPGPPNAEAPGIEWLFAVESSPRRPAGEGEGVAPQATAALRAAVQLLADLHNARLQAGEIDRPFATIANRQQDGLLITRYENLPLLPMTERASFGLVDKYLTIASTDEMVLDSGRIEPKRSLASKSDFAAGLSPRLPNPGQVAYFDAGRFVELSQTHFDEMVTIFSLLEGRSRRAAARDLDDLVRFLRLCHSVVISAGVDDAGIGFCLSAVVRETP